MLNDKYINEDDISYVEDEDDDPKEINFDDENFVPPLEFFPEDD